MPARVWTTAILAVCLTAFESLAAAGEDAGRATPLQKEIGALLVQLETVATRDGKATSRGPTRLEGIAWESPDGLAFGTSGLGAYLDRQVGAVFSRTHDIDSRDGVLGTRGGLGKLISGAFRPVAGGIRLTLRLIDELSDQKISEVSKVFGLDLFPAAALEDMEPPDSGNLLSLGNLVEQALGRSESAFDLRIRTDRGKHAAYVEGEVLSVFVEAERDCHVRLYHVSWKNRRMTLIHPNQFDRDDTVRAGVVRRIPSDPETAVFEVAPPYGVDAIVAVASETPFADEEEIASRWESGEDPPEDSSSEGSEGDDLEYEDGYLVENNVDERSVEMVLERGLVVRPGRQRHDGIDTAFLAGDSKAVARASCYFATVKKLF